MVKIESFEAYAIEYEVWYDKHRLIYELELEAVKALLPRKGVGIEIGVGTGRFALPLGIMVGVDPSSAMRKIAQAKGIHVIDGVAEVLPIPDKEYDFVLFVTTICFLDYPEQAFREAYRILKPGGSIVIGFIDKNSPVGQSYEKHKQESRFYKDAIFHSADEIVSCLQDAGFKDFSFVQTIFQQLDKILIKEPYPSF